MQLGTVGVPGDTLHAELSRLLADDTVTFWTDVDRLAYLNQAYGEITDFERPISKYVSQPVPPLISGVTFPPDFLALAPGGVTWEFDNQPGTVYQLERRDIPSLDRLFNGWQTTSAPSGTPMYYFLEPQNPSNNTVTLVPKPTTAGVMRVAYIAQVAPLTNAADVPWGGSFAAHHRLIAARAEVFARQKEQDLGAEQKAVERYAQLLGLFRQAILGYAPQAAPYVRASGYRRELSSGRT
jgi:hypothetical protein